MGDLFKDIQPVYLIDSLLNLLKKRSESDATDGKSVPQQKQNISCTYAYCPSCLMLLFMPM